MVPLACERVEQFRKMKVRVEGFVVFAQHTVQTIKLPIRKSLAFPLSSILCTSLCIFVSASKKKARLPSYERSTDTSALNIFSSKLPSRAMSDSSHPDSVDPTISPMPTNFTLSSALPLDLAHKLAVKIACHIVRDREADDQAFLEVANCLKFKSLNMSAEYDNEHLVNVRTVACRRHLEYRFGWDSHLTTAWVSKPQEVQVVIVADEGIRAASIGGRGGFWRTRCSLRRGEHLRPTISHHWNILGRSVFHCQTRAVGTKERC